MKEVKEETSARRRLRNLLVLLMRCLAIACLVFAFAQPFFPQDTEVKKGEKAVSVFIDNSFSMSALSQDVPLLEKAKQRGREIINAYSVEDRFQILTNDFEGRHQRLVSKEDALSLIDEVQITPSVRAISQVLSRQNQALNSGTEDNQTAYVISDFQENISDFENYQDTTLEINLLPLQSVQERNIAIDSAWFDSPVQTINQTNPLVVQLKNYSTEDADNVRLSFIMDGQEKPVGTMSIPAGATVTDTVNVTILKTGWHEAKLTITDYPVQFDDNYFVTFNVADEINVLVINEANPSPFLEAALNGISYFKHTNQNNRNIEYSKFPDYQLIILNGIAAPTSGLASELNQYAFEGGNLLVFPSANANIDAYKSFLSTFPANELVAFEQQERMVSNINTEEFTFKDVFENKNSNLKLPVTQANYKISTFASRAEERLMTYRDGSSFLGKYKTGQGNLFLCAAPLDDRYNNLVRSGEVFIPMLYKMAISSSKDRAIAYVIGQDEIIETPSKVTDGELVYKLKGQQEEFIPEQKLVGSKALLGINNQISEAGFYNLFLNENEILDKFAFNYDRKESLLKYLSEDDISTQKGAKMSLVSATENANFTQLIGERSRGVVLWRWFIIFALIFLFIEALLIRFWKV